jgi:peptidoglycan/LPS O-acetylase OafA/YrhL
MYDAGVFLVSRRHYLMEVQGLRTVAALLVAVYHIWLHRVSGGVDVFFVVAGFFLAAGLLRRHPIGPGTVITYYAATLRRVLPGAMLVIAATAAAGYFLMPKALWSAQIDHAIASMRFIENYQLVAEGRSYIQAGLDASPFQQMWALSLQMQGYLVMPLLFLLASLIAKLPRVNLKVVAWIVFGTLFAGSFAYSVVLTMSDQKAAYFSSDTRAWEFVAGILLALSIDRIRLSQVWARILGLVALAVLVTFGLVLDVSSQFPGYAALVPVLTACAIIVAASNGGDIKLLNNRWVTGMADISFGFYLWHWPLLIFVRYFIGEDVGLFGGPAVVLGAAALAWLSQRFLEEPFRRWTPLESRAWLSIPLSLLFVVPAWGVVEAWDGRLHGEERAAFAELERYLEDPAARLPAGSILPAPVIARIDTPARHKESCQQADETSTKVKVCSFGDGRSGKTIFVVGGSHATQWMPALVRIAEARGHKVTSITRSGCAFALGFEEPERCQEWTKEVLKMVRKARPDLVVMIGTRYVAREERVLDGFLDILADFDKRGIRALALRDNPRHDFDVPQCVGLYGPDAKRCGVAREAVYAATVPTIVAPNVTFADLSDLFCDEAWCPAVRDGVLLYRDLHHLTRTYVLRYVDRIDEAVEAAFAGQAVVPAKL